MNSSPSLRVKSFGPKFLPMLLQLDIIIADLRGHLPGRVPKVRHGTVITKAPERIGVLVDSLFPGLCRHGPARRLEPAGVRLGRAVARQEGLGQQRAQTGETCADNTRHGLDAGEGPESAFIVQVFPLVSASEDDAGERDEAGADQAAVRVSFVDESRCRGSVWDRRGRPLT